LIAFSVQPADIENSLAALGTADLDGLVVTDDPLLEPLLARLIALTAERRLPAIQLRHQADRVRGWWGAICLSLAGRKVLGFNYRLI